MNQAINTQSGTRRHLWRIVGWGGAIALILTPLVAMQFTSEVNWDETDFIVASIIFGIVGGLIELAVRISKNWFFRFGAMFAVLAGFMVVWSNLAVGMIGNEDNPVNLWFGVVLLIAIAGSATSRLHKAVLPAAMFAAGVVQASIGLFAGILGSDPRGGVFSIVLALPWIIAGALFANARHASR
jgi:predicted membrane channel-forming protein YqfA (hemolysin III family)